MSITNSAELREAVVSINAMRRKRPKVDDRLFAQENAPIDALVEQHAESVKAWAVNYNRAVQSLTEVDPSISFREEGFSVNGQRAASAFRAEDARILRIK